MGGRFGRRERKRERGVRLGFSKVWRRQREGKKRGASRKKESRTTSKVRIPVFASSSLAERVFICFQLRSQLESNLSCSPRQRASSGKMCGGRAWASRMSPPRLHSALPLPPPSSSLACCSREEEEQQLRFRCFASRRTGLQQRLLLLPLARVEAAWLEGAS